jgi:lipopolysaccharide/colanic/teichoic acid biosynthesis glycosyltransferase
VGPRPERTFHANKLTREIPNYASRHIVKPGLTGWAQVNGFRGETDLTQRVKYDLYYIENWSFVFDLQIMVLTFFKRDNAY